MQYDPIENEKEHWYMYSETQMAYVHSLQNIMTTLTRAQNW